MKNNIIFLQFLFNETNANWPTIHDPKRKVLSFNIVGNTLETKKIIINNLQRISGIDNSISPFISPEFIINELNNNFINAINNYTNKLIVFKDNEDGLITFVKFINKICDLRKCNCIELLGSIIGTADKEFFKQYFGRNFHKPSILLNIDKPIEIYKQIGFMPNYFRYIMDNSVYNNKYELIN